MNLEEFRPSWSGFLGQIVRNLTVWNFKALSKVVADNSLHFYAPPAEDRSGAYSVSPWYYIRAYVTSVTRV